jgi:hypothetical protein
MKIAEAGENCGLSADTLAQKGRVGGKHKIQQYSINMRSELCKM